MHWINCSSTPIVLKLKLLYMKKFILYFFLIVTCTLSEKIYAQGDCVCEYGSATPVGNACYIVNACSDPLASNYCEGTIYLNENCIYSGSEGCTC